MRMKIVYGILAGCVLLGSLSACIKEEVDSDDLASVATEASRRILSKTVSRPGGEPFAQGKVGGEWVSTINNDPKTFNDLTARDEDSRTVIDLFSDFLADFDPYTREWKPNLAEFRVENDTEAEQTRVYFTLRDDIYWTTPGQELNEGVKVTSDDAVFWYNEIEGNIDLQLPAYPGQFLTLPDGSKARIEIEKIDDRSFVFIYPQIIANPILSSNMSFGPRHIYQPALEADGVEGVLNLFSVDTDVRTIPSIGGYHIVEYTPGVRIVLERNPNYWKKDENGVSLPYIERAVLRIVPDINAEFLLFKDGTKDNYGIRPEDLDELVNEQNKDYTVYNGGPTLGAGMISINQNPNGLEQHMYEWFIQKEFRQAMSSLLNRPRIARQIYRGLAAPAHHFFARPNIYFDEDIRLEYTYDPDRAVELLKSIGIERGEDGLMYDSNGLHIEFDIIMGAENNVGVDTANLFADELKSVGITLQVRPIDFQKLVEQLTSTYDWNMVLLGGFVNYWPSGGSNIWQSNGNFHLWYPLQESPATEWERRIDELYDMGRQTPDPVAARKIYDEYQRIILEQLPILYTVHPISFVALRDRWDNAFYDTLNGLDTSRLFLKELQP